MSMITATQRENARDKLFTRRALLLAGGKAALLSTLVGRLYYLQVVEADRYTMLAEDNRINLKLLPPPRGRIIDRFGEPLATNRLSYRVVLVPEQARNVEAMLDALAQLIEVTDRDKARVMREMRRKRGFVPIMVRGELDWDDVTKIEVNAPDLPGVFIDVGQTRFYPHTESVGHVLGYVGAVSEAELTGEPLLELPDFRIGKNGVEKVYDRELRGAAGSSQIEVNAVGRVIRELGRQDGTPGRDVELTLDIELQEFTRNRVGEESAAACCMDVHTGEILALVSAPAYDPNMFASGLKASEWEELLHNPKTPLTNKAIAGQYPPGSTFKMVTALAALEAGVVTPGNTVFCPGHMDLGDHRFHCWKKGGHGSVDMTDGLKFSCDVYFYELAKRTGIDKLSAMAKRLGFGAPIGIDLPGERPGLIPSREWKLATKGHGWAQGETLIAGIGQGYVLTTPLQLAVMAARLSNGGFGVVPHLMRSVSSRAGSGARHPPYPSLGLNAAHLAAVLRGMNAVVNDGRGTANKSRITQAGWEMAGKTGSAQVRRITMAERERGLKKQEDLPWRDRDHALFVAFAPVGAPRYACSVVVEHGGGGSAVAAPIARDILIEVQRRDPSRRTPGGGRIAGTTPEKAGG